MRLAANEVRCPTCRHIRIVTVRHARRVQLGQHDPRCRRCRNAIPQATDAHLRFWLNVYGAPCPANEPVREWVREHGIPPELKQLAHDIFNT
jgi:hypothetical protein